MPDTTSELAAHGAQPAALMIDARDVRKAFGHVQVLRGVSLSVHRGEVVAVIGPSGSGKSTFLRCLNHLETIDSGHIAIEGETLVSTDSQGRSHYAPEAQVRRICARTGMVFQHFNLFPHLSVLGNLIEAPITVRKLARAEVVPRAEALLAKVGLADKRDVYPGRLSGGQHRDEHRRVSVSLYWFRRQCPSRPSNHHPAHNFGQRIHAIWWRLPLLWRYRRATHKTPRRYQCCSVAAPIHHYRTRPTWKNTH